MAWTDAARAAAAEARRRKRAGLAWRYRDHIVSVRMKDPLLVAASQKLVVKKIRVTARDAQEASARATKFFTKSGYKNISPFDVVRKLIRTRKRK